MQVRQLPGHGATGPPGGACMGVPWLGAEGQQATGSATCRIPSPPGGMPGPGGMKAPAPAGSPVCCLEVWDPKYDWVNFHNEPTHATSPQIAKYCGRLPESPAPLPGTNPPQESPLRLAT